MHDGITFEKLLIPALTICTTPFEPTSKATAQAMGIPEFQYALIAHPIGSRSDEELRVRAADAYQQGVNILLGSN